MVQMGGTTTCYRFCTLHDLQYCSLSYVSMLISTEIRHRHYAYCYSSSNVNRGHENALHSFTYSYSLDMHLQFSRRLITCIFPSIRACDRRHDIHLANGRICRKFDTRWCMHGTAKDMMRRAGCKYFHLTNMCVSSILMHGQDCNLQEKCTKRLLNQTRQKQVHEMVEYARHIVCRCSHT
jgi:hypothetical protein